MPDLSNGKLIRNLLIESFSEEHIRIIDSLNEPKHDEDIAEELNVKATIIRTLLNDLHSASLVEYERTKNKKTGWYTYKWRRRDDKVGDHIQSYLDKKLDELNRRLEEEKTGIAFTCGCDKISYDEALESNFLCSKCEKSFKEYYNADVIDQITEEIAEINAMLEQT
ncbi:hypothetical protein ACFLRC_03850 [Candidatus Altiarchaeota archaeon]